MDFRVAEGPAARVADREGRTVLLVAVSGVGSGGFGLE